MAKFPQMKMGSRAEQLTYRERLIKVLYLLSYSFIYSHIQTHPSVEKETKKKADGSVHKI